MKKTVLFILILCSIHFWRYVLFPESFQKLTDLLTLSIFIISLISVYKDKGLRFKNAILLFLVGLILNVFSAYLNNGQEIKDTALSLHYYYFILFYFYLHEFKVSRKDLEDFIIVFAILYSIFYLLQNAAFPRILFYENIFSDRGTIRMRIEGDGFLMLAYFLLLNRYFIKRKLPDLLLALFFFFILIMAGFRSLTAGAVLLTGVIFIRLVRYSPMNYFMIVLAVVLFIGVLQMESTSSIIDEMFSASEQQKQQGDRYIRVMNYDYFTKAYPENFSYYIFGGGFPGGRGAYAHRMGYMVTEYGFYWVDLGLVGFLLVMGLITTSGLIWFTIKAIFIKLPPDSLYLNIYFAFLIIVTNITLDQMYRLGIFGVEAIVLYLIDISRDELKGKLNYDT